MELSPNSNHCWKLSRRDVLRVGAAGFFGLSLPRLLSAKERVGRRACAVGDLPASMGRAGAARHVRHEAPRPGTGSRHFQADRQHGSGDSGLRIAAAHGGRDGQSLRHSHRHAHDEEPQLGRLLQPDRARPADRRSAPARLARSVPRLRLGGRSVRARATAACRPSWPIRTSSATARSRPASTPAFSARRTIRCSSPRTRTSATFRLPELSLPSDHSRTARRTAARC